MTNQYRPDEHAAARILAAFAALGNEIAALQLELQLQRERADDATRDAADARTAMHNALRATTKLRLYVAELEQTFRVRGCAGDVNLAAARAHAHWQEIQGEGDDKAVRA